MTLLPGIYSEPPMTHRKLALVLPTEANIEMLAEEAKPSTTSRRLAAIRMLNRT